MELDSLWSSNGHIDERLNINDGRWNRAEVLQLMRGAASVRCPSEAMQAGSGTGDRCHCTIRVPCLIGPRMEIADEMLL